MRNIAAYHQFVGSKAEQPGGKARCEVLAELLEQEARAAILLCHLHQLFHAVQLSAAHFFISGSEPTGGKILVGYTVVERQVPKAAFWRHVIPVDHRNAGFGESRAEASAQCDANDPLGAHPFPSPGFTHSEGARVVDEPQREILAFGQMSFKRRGQVHPVQVGKFMGHVRHAAAVIERARHGKSDAEQPSLGHFSHRLPKGTGPGFQYVRRGRLVVIVAPGETCAQEFARMDVGSCTGDVGAADVYAYCPVLLHVFLVAILGRKSLLKEIEVICRKQRGVIPL
jgi:hypothetical protein